MRKRTTLADLLKANGETSTSALLKALLPQLEADETGATKDCDCPGCQHFRAVYAQQQQANKGQPEAPSASDAEGSLVQTIASLVVNDEIVSVGFTVPETEDVQQRVAVRFSQDSTAEVLTSDQARILGQALLAAANHID